MFVVFSIFVCDFMFAGSHLGLVLSFLLREGTGIQGSGSGSASDSEPLMNGSRWVLLGLFIGVLLVVGGSWRMRCLGVIALLLVVVIGEERGESVVVLVVGGIILGGGVDRVAVVERG